jgi:hypothetical protein
VTKPQKIGRSRAVCDQSWLWIVGPGMTQNDDDEPMLKPDGHRYEKPESRETTVSKEVVYAVLALLVVIIAILIATGTVQIFPGG